MSVDREQLVSVIIPAYNQARYLRTTVESILAQTYHSLEVIVVDDGSTDATPQIAQGFGARVRYIRQSNRGVGAARNVGIAAAAGDFLTFMDHDDVMAPGKIERQVDYFRHRPAAQLVNCGYYTIDAADRRMSREWILPAGAVLNDLIYGDFLWVGGPLVRREVIQMVGLFDEASPWTADWNYWLRTALAGVAFECVQAPLGAYRILPGSMMSYPERLEQSAFFTLERAFQDARMPAATRAQQARACGAQRLWLGFRYLQGGHVADGVRNLREAFTQRPDYLNQPETLLSTLRGHALSPHVTDSLAFFDDAFEQLIGLSDRYLCFQRQYRSEVLFVLALRAYAEGAIERGQAGLQEAFAHYPDWKGALGRYEGLLVDEVMRSPDPQAHRLVDRVLGHLPPGSELLEKVRRSALGRIHAGRAFERYYSRQGWGVLAELADAAVTFPPVLRNRGVYSILWKALTGDMP